MRSGLIYTTFAILASSLLLLLASLPVAQPVGLDSSQAMRISEASFFLDSVLDDMDRSLEIATRRALTGSTNYVIETGNRLVEPGENVSSALVNGSISGVELNSTENASLEDWASRVSDIAARSGYSLDVELSNSSFNGTGFTVSSSYSVFTRLKDPVTLASFNRTKSAETSVSITGLEDPMILLRSEGRYVSQYSECGFDSPATQLQAGKFYSESEAHGAAEVKPNVSEVENTSEKVIVMDDVDNYDESDVESFAAAVSAEPNSSQDADNYDTTYVFDTGSISGIEENDSLIVNRGEVWSSHFREMFTDNCYLETDRGPGFMDRFANRLVSGNGSGLATLLEVSELPAELQETESAVGYVYFNDSGDYGDLKKVRGVTSEHSWFRIDQHHVTEWGLEGLAYE